MGELCTRCGEREALPPNEVIGFTHGGFCSECAAENVRDLVARLAAPVPPRPEVTPPPPAKEGRDRPRSAR